MTLRNLSRFKRNPAQAGVLMLSMFLSVAIFSRSVAHAQSATSEIVGTVKDATGAVLPGVALTVTHGASGQVRHLTTDAGGNYVVPSLPIGEYTIKAELPNFKTEIRQGI